MPGSTTRGDLDPNAMAVATIFFERSLTDPYLRWACPLHPTGDWVFGRWVYANRASAMEVLLDGLKRHLVTVHPDFTREREPDDDQR